ncbi:uncharacterized protein ACHE_11283A [Aspergillus chevalieri]|uniref:YAG7-like dimerisation domain-containing protein n=1 Tax=Aspergillus chevalieri TaxID=182096 RepID=A0A7R7VFJ3_ASPCH|nr:uncharacterized protein ACHE_11283A [Aspergillus chevalieri]BCR83881.1 hypothetical protein ACHE_11283A [Aspergillus chevalieri]
MAAAPVTSNPQSEAPSEKQKLNGTSSSEATANSLDNLDNPRFKELQRSLRNALKKLNATSKVDSIIAENPGKSLDELVADKKINNDQKTQALKKPALQANVAQIEEQIAHYKEFAAYYEERLASQKDDLKKGHKEELDSVREKAIAETSETSQKDLRRRLLTLSKFLLAAAEVRRSGDETSTDAQAFEAVLYQVYTGSEDAVTNMLKLIDGVDEKITNLEGTELEVTYGKVKQASEGPAPTSEEATTETTPASDPTLANAASTELQDTAVGAMDATTADANGTTVQTEQIAPPAQTMVSNAANEIAESSWDPNTRAPADPSANANGLIEVPRDPAETENGLQATPASVDTGLKNNPVAVQPEAENAAVPKQNGDGFEPVGGHQRQNSGRGRGRGRGRGDGFRGRGRGEFRGRGRGRGHGRGRGGSNGAPAVAAAAQ